MRGLIFLEGLIFGRAYLRREICVSKSIGQIVKGRKFAIFALFFFVLEGKFQVQAPPPPGAYIRRGDLTEGFLRYDFGGLIFGILRYIDCPQKKLTVVERWPLWKGDR